MARLAATMVLLSAVFWFTSWPPVPLGKDFPNCVSARCDGTLLACGVLSNYYLSTVFITRYVEPGRAVWSERADYHFCNFPVPTANWGVPKVGFHLTISPTTIGWDCPYWLMAGLWTFVAARYYRAWQFRVGDLIYFTTVIAFAVTAIQLRVALPLVLMMNLVTVALCAMLVFCTVRCFWTTPNPLWPLALLVPEVDSVPQDSDNSP